MLFVIVGEPEIGNCRSVGVGSRFRAFSPGKGDLATQERSLTSCLARIDHFDQFDHLLTPIRRADRKVELLEVRPFFA